MKQHNKRFKDKNGNPRYRLSEDEADIINKYRRIKQEAENSGVNPNGWSWLGNVYYVVSQNKI